MTTLPPTNNNPTTPITEETKQFSNNPSLTKNLDQNLSLRFDNLPSPEHAGQMAIKDRKEKQMSSNQKHAMDTASMEDQPIN